MRRLSVCCMLLLALTACSGAGTTGSSPLSRNAAYSAAQTVPATTATTTSASTQRRTAGLSPDVDAIVNGGFEQGLSPWVTVGSGRGTAKVVTTKAHSGTHSVFMGTSAAPAVNGLHGVSQTVTIPTGGLLTFWYQGKSDDTLQYADQEADITDASGTIVQQCYKDLKSETTWQEATCDVSALAGQTLNVVFGVNDNGYSNAYVDWYVDDVSLTGSGGPSPTPSPTGSATPTPTPTGSGSPTPTPTPTSTATGKPTPTPTPTGVPTPTPSPTASGSVPIQHVVIILQENRTLENVFHGYPGANTVNYGFDSNGNKVPLQAVHLMTPYDPAHRYSNWLTEYNNGNMNGFNNEQLDYGSNPPKDFAYEYAMQSDVQPYWDMATEGSLADEFFADHRSQSFAGHQFPIAGASGPITPSQPNYYASENPSGGETCDSPGTGPAINIQTGNEDSTYTSCFDYQTIADLLIAKNKTWRFYIDSSSRTSSYVSSFAVIKHIRNNPAQFKNVVSPATTVLSDAQNNTLANVSWVVGSFANSDHAGQNVPSSNGPSWVSSIVNGVGQSPSWNTTAVVLIYDDWGGWFDEQAPKQNFNAFEPGFRIPFVVVSPYSRRGYISHTTHYNGSLLHYIESTFGLGSLGTSDAHSDDLSDMFNYAQSPLPFTPIKAPKPPAYFFHQPHADAAPPGEDRD